MTVHNHKIESITAAWLLPIVSTIVAAATGGIVAGVVPHYDLKLITVITSYVLWATGVPLAMVVITVYFLRLTTVSLPPKAIIVSSFLPLGPLGQGSFGIMQLGKVASEVFLQQHELPLVANAGQVLYVMGFLIGIIMWGYGLIWLTIAVASIHNAKRFPFNMGWWGFTFPLGVYAVSTTTLAKELPSAFFRVVGTIFSLSVTLLWIVVALGTLYRAWTGEIFIAPCLKEAEEKEKEKEKERLEKKESHDLEAQK